MPGAHPVGVSTLQVANPTSKRRMAVEVWYPAAPVSHDRPILYAALYPGRAARDAAPADLGHKVPLVVVAHGLKSSRFDMSWLAEALAADGMVVAAVDHPGTSGDTWDPIEAPKVWRRAQHLSAVIDAMLAHPSLGAHLEPSQIAAIGHSAGGSAVVLLAGAAVDVGKFAAHFPASAPCPPGVGPDARVRAIVALAPGTGRIFAPAGVQRARAPALIVSGTRDTETPEPFNAAFYHANMPRSTWHSLPDVGHYTFKPLCTWYGKLRSRQVCTDRPGVDRAAVHAQVVAWSRSFLHDNLPPP